MADTSSVPGEHSGQLIVLPGGFVLIAVISILAAGIEYSDPSSEFVPASFCRVLPAAFASVLCVKTDCRRKVLICARAASHLSVACTWLSIPLTSITALSH